MSVFVYQFEDCLHACASYNSAQMSESTHNGSMCRSISYDYTLDHNNLSFADGNCFLKTKVYNADAILANEVIDSAFLS